MFLSSLGITILIPSAFIKADIFEIISNISFKSIIGALSPFESRISLNKGI